MLLSVLLMLSAEAFPCSCTYLSTCGKEDFENRCTGGAKVTVHKLGAVAIVEVKLYKLTVCRY